MAPNVSRYPAGPCRCNSAKEGMADLGRTEAYIGDRRHPRHQNRLFTRQHGLAPTTMSSPSSRTLRNAATVQRMEADANSHHHRVATLELIGDAGAIAFSRWYIPATLAPSRMTTDAARLALSERAASAIHPESIGPIAWPIANTTVNTAIAGPHAVFGSDVLIRSVILVGTREHRRPEEERGKDHRGQRRAVERYRCADAGHYAHRGEHLRGRPP